jgi:DNA/RNA endonuclease G (NUC1)
MTPQPGFDRDDKLRYLALAVAIISFGFVVGWVLRPSCGAEPPHYQLSDFAPTREWDPMPGGWALSWNGARRVPDWTLERLTSKSFGEVKRGDLGFHHDEHEQKEFPSSPDDYNGFTHLYDRGHAARADNHSDTAERMRATFTIRNAFPQNKTLNEQLWRHLEDYIQSLCKPGVVVWVVTLTVWTPDDYPRSWGKRDATYTVKSIGLNHQQVPPYCAKAVLVQHGNEFAMQSWLVPNEEPPEGATFRDYEVVTDKLEELAGVNLWKRLSPGLQEKLESGEGST